MENKFNFPIEIDWTLLPVLNKTTNTLVKNPFKVLPAKQEVAANSNFIFNVDFAPYEPDSYFFQIAQCFITLKNGNHNRMKQFASDAPMGRSMGASQSITK